MIDSRWGFMIGSEQLGEEKAFANELTALGKAVARGGFQKVVKSLLRATVNRIDITPPDLSVGESCTDVTVVYGVDSSNAHGITLTSSHLLS
jgi:hypothetical protein